MALMSFFSPHAFGDGRGTSDSDVQLSPLSFHITSVSPDDLLPYDCPVCHGALVPGGLVVREWPNTPTEELICWLHLECWTPPDTFSSFDQGVEELLPDERQKVSEYLMKAMSSSSSSSSRRAVRPSDLMPKKRSSGGGGDDDRIGTEEEESGEKETATATTTSGLDQLRVPTSGSATRNRAPHTPSGVSAFGYVDSPPPSDAYLTEPIDDVIASRKRTRPVFDFEYSDPFAPTVKVEEFFADPFMLQILRGGRNSGEIALKTFQCRFDPDAVDCPVDDRYSQFLKETGVAVLKMTKVLRGIQGEWYWFIHLSYFRPSSA